MAKWPRYYGELLKYGDPDSPVGMVTLWTICDKIVQNLDKKKYCLAGQLYTKTGINFLLRNLLTNKRIRYLVVCGQDRGGSGKELKEIWTKGDGETIQKEIPRSSLKNLVENVKLIDLIGVEDEKTISEAVERLDLNVGSYGDPEDFAEPKNEKPGELRCAFPTDSSVFKVNGKSIAQTWLKALQAIMKFGDVKQTDAMQMKEVLNLCAVVDDEDPDNFQVPSWLGFDVEKVKNYLPQVVGANKNPGLHYTYGNRLQGHFKVNQLEKIIKKLKKDENAREAVGILFDPNSDHDAEHRPCIVLVQALKNRGKLNFNAYVRSHDIFGGWPLNAFGLRKLQKTIADKVGIAMGALTLISASAHVYDFNWDEAQKVVAKNLKNKFELDSRGYFKIKIDKRRNQIIAEHFSPEGLFLEKFTQEGSALKAALSLCEKIDQRLCVSLTSHAFDLGIELQKAEMALKIGLEYVQDKPLHIK